MAVEFDHYGLIWEEIAGACREAVRETITEIEKDVKGGGPHAAPYRTGNLRRSYHSDFKGTNGVQIEAHIGSDPGVAEYAIFVEFGTSRMAPRPHLTPASETQRGPHAMRIAAAVSEATGHGPLGGFAQPESGVSGLGASSSDYLTDY